MGGEKRFKDPVYGYVHIPNKYIEIIDTAVFQRLRRIVQTSYAPLYSSAVHNRFVHSMGVYHLGELAITNVIESIDDEYLSQLDIDIMRCAEIFKLACLLHDVGHAPFSHTGEQFYLTDQSDYTVIHNLLVELVGSDGFDEDIPHEKRKAAAPHEIMSAIIGISNFSTFLPEAFDREFFARCITGYKYLKKSGKNSLLNCLISLLNSKVIDVDKLDYLIRDAFIIGFDTVDLDYMRLLNAMVIVEIDDRFEIAYKKTALSVIENVVYAHDAERKWIQNHPIVLYECYILQNIFKILQDQFKREGIDLFSKEALGNAGIELKNGTNIRLLCDDDIVYLMKNVCRSDWSEQYLERKKRMHPVWKSEAEYKALILNKFIPDTQKKFERAMESLVKYLARSSDEWIADDNLIDKINQEIETIKENNELDFLDKKVQREDKNNVLKILRCLQNYAKEHNMKNEFVFISASQFNSGFGKPDFAKTYIVFDEEHGKKARFGDVVNTLQTKESDSGKYFYLFYNRKNGQNSVNSYEICQRLCNDFNNDSIG